MRAPRWTLPIRFLLLLGFVIQSVVSIAQTTRPNRRDPVIVDPRTSKQITIKQSPPSTLATDTTYQDSVVNFIVRLKTSPGAKNARGRASQAAQISQEHQDFLSKLNELGNANGRTSGDAKTIKVVQEYKRTFNGFALKANRSFSDAIKKMPHVISVTEDKKVKANDETSNNVIKVPQVWNEVGATGDGVVIGIIDTGIDYNHPDLGNGIGPEHKVIGGYDFINNDDDPFDDNGHGTHVAGIAAANGTLKGVAPDAKLMAIKVLDSYGYGYDSHILAGIEYAIDPDGDPETDDAPDVVNMSLGRMPDPAEPLSEAVNNAVLQGICFVIAAGNDWTYFRIGTPGIAEQAITVAAIDNYDFTAYFSSKGPVDRSFMLKPDVAAPGVGINSTFPGGKYELLDGTSMASPHITGVAALMLDKHPDWTPGDVKAAMMSTARNYSNDRILETGAGIVDAYKAITTDIIMSPGSISYGRPQTSEETWTRHDVITITNKGTSSKQMELELKGLNDGAIDIVITPSEFTLEAGGTREVAIDIEVNMASLASQSVPNGYFGNIELTSGDKTLKTLLSLFNPTVTTIEFTNSLPGSLIIGGLTNGYWQPFNPTTKEFEVMLPTGGYDILAWFGDSLVVVEDFEATVQSKNIAIDSKSASNKIEFKPVDKNGALITLDQPVMPGLPGTIGATMMRGPTTISMWFGAIPSFHFSNSKKYKMFTRIFNIPSNPGEYYEIALSTGEEISSSMVLTNDPETFIPITVKNPSTPEGQSQNFFFQVQCLPFTTWNSMPVQVSNPTSILLSEDPTDNTFSYYRFLPSTGSSGFTWETSQREINPERGLEFSNLWEQPIRTVGDGPYDFELGKSFPNVAAYMSNWERIQLTEQGRGLFNHAYGERLAGTIPWSLKSNDQIISSGLLRNTTVEDAGAYTVLDLEAPTEGPYQLTLNWDSYYVGGRFGTVTVEQNFSKSFNSYYDHEPPVISQYILTSGQQITNRIEAGKGGKISLKINEYNAPATTLEMKAIDAETWETLALTIKGDTTLSVIPEDILPGYYSLRLKSTDLAGNSITHTMNPAFVVGEGSASTPFTKVSLISPSNYDLDAGITPNFEWSSVANAKYTFQLSKTATFDGLVADLELTTTTYSQTEPLEKDAIYYWRVKATVDGSELPWSTVFAFYASKLAGAVLLSPVMSAVDVPIAPTKFKWIPVNQDWQYIEVATDTNFFFVVYSEWLMPAVNENEIYSLSKGEKYFWRVRSRYITYYKEYAVYSETFSFNAAGVKPPVIPDPPVVPDPPDDDPPVVPDPDDDDDPPVVPDPDDDPDDDPDNDPDDDPDDDPNVVTELEDDGGLSFYPNPFTDRTYVRLVAKTDDVVRISLLDHLGRQVRTSQHNLAKGENTLTIETESLDSNDAPLTQGMYIALIETNSQQAYRVKVVKR